MAQQTINVGASPNDGTGTPLRTAFQYTNSNFSELYTAVGPSGNNIVVPGSATITGALAANADTTLGTASKSTNTNLNFSSDLGTQRIYLDRGTRSLVFQDVTSSIENYRIAGITGVHTWGVGGSTAMTLNSTGLGVGTSSIVNAAAGRGNVTIGGSSSAILNLSIGAVDTGYVIHDGTSIYLVNRIAAGSLIFSTNSTERLRIDSSGNVGIGVTPSAWSGTKALQIGSGSAVSDVAGDFHATANAYNTTTGWVYISNAAATDYYQRLGAHVWRTTGAGTGAITWTQAMTLDASGTLLVGTTSAGASGFRCYLSTDSGTTKWSVGPYVSATNFAIVASGSAGGVYLNGTTATSWTALSDERFKDIIEPISNAVAKVGSLRAVIGKIKGDETNTRKSFLIAQDVESVLPEAVDASNPDRLGLAYTDVIPLLVAAIKELTARVQTLETR